MTLHFCKYQGAGNDFVMLDNRNHELDALSTKQIRQICDRRFGIGADGLILLQLKAGFDFEMKYFNADGKESSLCGNGARCLVKYAYAEGIHKNSYHFYAIDGEHQAEIEPDHTIRLKMQDVQAVEKRNGSFVLNTGSPHYVKKVNDVRNLNVYEKGREIRYSRDYENEGINVNFVETLNENSIYVRTYERGVENETLSCGTGAVAAAIASAHNNNGFNRVEIETKGGNLSVEFEKINEQHFSNIWLSGPAEFVFEGTINL